MKFTLEKSASSDHAVSRFSVRASNGSLCGWINVPPEAEGDLLSHWKGSTPPATARASTDKQTNAINAMVKAARKNRLTKQAILRGCC